MNQDKALTTHSGSLATAEILGDLGGFVQLHAVQGSVKLKHHPCHWAAQRQSLEWLSRF